MKNGSHGRGSWVAQFTWWMELRVAWTERASCYAGLHASTAQQLFREPTQHFCRVLRLGDGRYIGWAGDVAAQPGTLEVTESARAHSYYSSKQVQKSC